MLSNVEKGTEYEIFIKDYLEQQNPDNYYWLWKDVPEGELRKSGILGNWNVFRFNRKRNNQIEKKKISL